MGEATLADFPISFYDKVRFSDTDKQGHVNNAVFATYLETGRAEFLYHHEPPFNKPGTNFVIASLNIALKAEIHWPGKVDIGTCISRVGNSSFSLSQAIFQNDLCVATADTVIVQVDKTTKRSSPLSEKSVTLLNQYIQNPESIPEQ